MNNKAGKYCYGKTIKMINEFPSVIMTQKELNI